MTSDQVVSILRHYNAWRRDDEGAVEMPAPSDIGEAIDAAIHLLNRRRIGEAMKKIKQEEESETI